MKQHYAMIRFYGPLNDFLKKSQRQKTCYATFAGSPAVKDTIENCGVPHPEIDRILVNSSPVDFSYQIHNGDYISVYPYWRSIKDPKYGLCRNHTMDNPAFLIDINLAKLGRFMRMLGFDALLAETDSDALIAKRVSAENRILLSRDIGLLKHKIIAKGYWVRNDFPKLQLEEVLCYFDLFSNFRPFTRCIRCNSIVVPVKKELIIENLPPGVREYYNEYCMCPTCRRIYWKGNHYKKMLQTLHGLNGILLNGTKETFS